MLNKIPKPVIEILQELEENNFDGFLVGGCVRDLLLGKNPKDWDVTTNAKPEEVQKIFANFAGATDNKPGTFYENNFGTVGVKIKKQDPRNKEQETKSHQQSVISNQ